MKRKHVRTNEELLMTKKSHKVIMKRSRLRNKFLKIRMKITETTIKFNKLL